MGLRIVLNRKEPVMEIGKPERVITIEPVKEPIPKREPAPEPDRDPVREPEKAPA